MVRVALFFSILHVSIALSLEKDLVDIVLLGISTFCAVLFFEMVLTIDE